MPMEAKFTSVICVSLFYHSLVMFCVPGVTVSTLSVFGFKIQSQNGREA
jgi:hypothetical protein